MYSYQPKNQLKIGYNGLGQLPTGTATVTVAGKQITFSGPAHEMGPATALAGLLNTAYTSSQQGKINEAKQAVTAAKNLLPATGSLRSKIEPAVNMIENLVSLADAPANEPLSPPPIYLTPVQASGPNYLLIGGGVSILMLLLILVLRK